jgi:hypothetical protein
MTVPPSRRPWLKGWGAWFKSSWPGVSLPYAHISFHMNTERDEVHHGDTAPTVREGLGRLLCGARRNGGCHAHGRGG